MSWPTRSTTASMISLILPLTLPLTLYWGLFSGAPLLNDSSISLFTTVQSSVVWVCDL